jgi:hypothetical protein
MAYTFSVKGYLKLAELKTAAYRGEGVFNFAERRQRNVKFTSVFRCRYGAIRRGFAPLLAHVFAANGGRGTMILLSSLLQSYV